MTKEEKLTIQVQELHAAIKALVAAMPEFNGANELVHRIGTAQANVESTLHWDFGCWELGLPTL